VYRVLRGLSNLKWVSSRLVLENKEVQLRVGAFLPISCHRGPELRLDKALSDIEKRDAQGLKMT
jgi:hypothetical protein